MTAFPVLARILTDRGMQRSRLGVLALTCAAVGDVSAWCLLAFVVSVVRSQVGDAFLTFGLVALYVAVFPANIYMAIHHLPLGDYQPSSFALWARLPFQLVFIAWALWAGKTPPRAPETKPQKP